MKVYHLAAKISVNGDVSAFCFAKPRAINLALASWTIIAGAVTCPRCRKAMRVKNKISLIADVLREAPQCSFETLAQLILETIENIETSYQLRDSAETFLDAMHRPNKNES
jgi:hypothetical protein